AVELTAEGWFFMTSLPDPPAEAFLMGKAGVFEIVVGSDSRVRGRLYPPSSGAPFTLTSTGAITLQTWHHIALLVDRTNNRAYIALNGKISNVVPPPTALAQNTNRFTVGSTDGTNLWVGMADEIRVTQDVRYPATGFTPPLELLVPDSPFISGARNTVHALYHFDEAAGAFQFRDFSLRLNTLFRIGLSGFQPFGRMRIPRQFHTATENAFNDGRIWIAGGIDSAGNAVIESEMIGVNGEVAFDGDLSVPMIIQVIKKKVGEGDGATTIFTFSLTPGVLQPGSVKVTAGSVVATDDGVGNMSGTGIASGTVDYTTGDVRLTYAAGSIPASGVPVTADYNFQRNSGILNHTATRLSDGRIVVAGGEDDQREPRGELFLITPTISPPGVSIVTPLSFSLNTPRRFHTATALADDSVQIALGEGLTNTLSSIEVLEPAPSLPDTFSLGTPRSHVASKLHKAVIPRSCDSTLPSEMLLLVGGYDGTNTPSKGSPPLRTGRVRHALACLPDGKILVTGGISKFGTVLDTVERYDPATDAYTLLSTGMNTPRADHTATLLDNGTVLIAGGFDQNGQAIQSAEIYDPAQNRFTILSSRMSQGRFGHIALPWTDLSTGNKGVLLIGGSDNDGRPIALLEIYFP
ncbi:MAG: kelch repeat-containing protein, partial [Nitrospiria bacterium]